MELNTASQVISFSRKLEEDSAGFYEDLSRRYAADEDIFLAFARENRKNIVQVERAYYGVISDAIEGCFSFKVDPADYAVEIEMAGNASYSDALDKAVQMERKIIEFYTDAAEQAKLLLADVPRIFTLIARRRSDRIVKLESLGNKDSQRV